MTDSAVPQPSRIYHVTFERDWAEAQSTGEYRISTRGAHLDDVGYIHASFVHQVPRIGELIFREAAGPLVVLVIDPARVNCPVRVESFDGGTDQFPHIYGPLPTNAVVDVLPARHEDGTFVVDGLTG